MLMRPKLDDPAWLDAKNNKRARVADAMDRLAGWANASERARRQPGQAAGHRLWRRAERDAGHLSCGGAERAGTRTC
jgi:hypothetical protein